MRTDGCWGASSLHSTDPGTAGLILTGVCAAETSAFRSLRQVNHPWAWNKQHWEGEEALRFPRGDVNQPPLTERKDLLFSRPYSYDFHRLKHKPMWKPRWSISDSHEPGEGRGWFPLCPMGCPNPAVCLCRREPRSNRCGLERARGAGWAAPWTCLRMPSGARASAAGEGKTTDVKEMG